MSGTEAVRQDPSIRCHSAGGRTDPDRHSGVRRVALTNVRVSGIGESQSGRNGDLMDLFGCTNAMLQSGQPAFSRPRHGRRPSVHAGLALHVGHVIAHCVAGQREPFSHDLVVQPFGSVSARRARAGSLSTSPVATSPQSASYPDVGILDRPKREAAASLYGFANGRKDECLTFQPMEGQSVVIIGELSRDLLGRPQKGRQIHRQMAELSV